MATTSYKAGDRIYGPANRNFFLHITTVHWNGDIEGTVHMPNGDEYWMKKGDGSWGTVWNGGGFFCNSNTTFEFKTIVYDYSYRWVQWRWFGNKYGNVIRYGHNPHTDIAAGSHDGPKWEGGDEFVRTAGYSPNDWMLVDGTYQWAEGLWAGDWYGWYWGNYNDLAHNKYARPVKGQIRRKSPLKNEAYSGVMVVDGIRSIPDKTPPAITTFDGKNTGDVLIPKNPYVYESYFDINFKYYEDTSKFYYNAHDGTFTDPSGNKRDMDIKNGTRLTEYGTYTVSVRVRNKESQDLVIEHPVTMVKRDPIPPPSVIIYDKQDPSIEYDMSNRVFIGPCYPTITVPYQCVVENCIINGEQYSLGSALYENGTYNMKVVIRKVTNNMYAEASALFTIDNLPPDPPKITIGQDSWQGKDFGLVGRYPNPVSPVITSQPGSSISQKVWYKENLKSTTWTPIQPDQTYYKKGIYRIEAVAKKHTNKLTSDPTIIEFYKKIKYRFTITLTPDTLCYRTIASVNFPNDLTLKKMYKIDDGEWKWYRDPVKIYKNCVMYVKSLDGDDDYESFITAKVIDIIDTEPPKKPIIVGVEEGDITTVVIPTVKLK